jgi:gliding motility-associated protein GldL
MDDKALKKRLRGKVMMHMLFGLGGAVVIIGALFKILHLEIGPITGGLVLGLGLGTEALIFTVSALNTGEIKEEHEDFAKKLKVKARLLEKELVNKDSHQKLIKCFKKQNWMLT